MWLLRTYLILFFAEVSEPVVALTSHTHTKAFIWFEQKEDSFKNLQNIFKKTLSQQANFNVLFYLDTDASKFAISFMRQAQINFHYYSAYIIFCIFESLLFLPCDMYIKFMFFHLSFYDTPFLIKINLMQSYFIFNMNLVSWNILPNFSVKTFLIFPPN